MGKRTILIVEDKESLNEYLEDLFIREGFEVYTAFDGKQGLEVVINKNPDIVLSDIKMPLLKGNELIEKIKSINNNIQIVIMTAFGTVDSAVECIKKGAFDYMTKPFDRKDVVRIVNCACEKKDLLDRIKYKASEVKEKFSFDEIIGKSDRIQNIVNLVRKILDSPTNVLITGESGTGKEVFARAIHFNSPRRNEPFIKVSCAALPEHLLESELFGHEKGSFTGAYYQKKGRFELAHKGTIFLDEIGEITPHIQVKLLRVLQNREFERVGGIKTKKVDVRIIAATNKVLQDELKSGNFREDLYFRLNTFNIELPPLRERRVDIEMLGRHFLTVMVDNGYKGKKYFSTEVLRILEKYNWPGNIRELENVVERAYIVSDYEEIKLIDLPDYLVVVKGIETGELPVGESLNDAVEEMESKLIMQAMQKCDGNQSKAAKLLKIKRGTLIYKMKKYGIF
ncbi:sigma-54-dependent Fis family transcriptional regulator [bacterium]|nr:sigma-54-dependent Fis family transcriptional regulator [bacterium]